MDLPRVARVGIALFAVLIIGWLAVTSRPVGVLGSEMWPAGLSTAALLFAGRRYLVPTCLLVAAIGTATFTLGGRPLDFALCAGVVILLECLVICSILTDRGRREATLRDDADLSRFVAALTVGCAGAGVALGVAAWLLTDTSPLLVGVGTTAGHMSSALVWLPLIVRAADHRAQALPAERIMQWATLVAVSVAVLLPHEFPSLVFLVMPVLAWTAMRSSLVETQLQLMTVATIATVMTTYGFGPLAQQVGAYALPEYVLGIVLQTYLIACALVVIPLSLAVGQQRAATHRAESERNVLRRVIDSAHVAIIGADPHGRITLFNPGAERSLGYRAEEVVGRPAAMLHTEQAIVEKAEELGVSPEFEQLAGVLAAPEHPGVHLRFLRKDGTERVHAMTLSQVHDSRGRVSGYVCTSADVQGEVAMQRALLDALDKERRAVERLREVDEVKDTFVSSVSHELRTPITSIVGYLEMLLEGEFGELDPPQQSALRRVDGNSKRLLTLIDELLTLSRVHEQQVGVTERLDLRDPARTAYDVVSPGWAHRELAVSLDLPEHEVLVAGNRELLERVLVNLLGNAGKFTPDGGAVALRLETEGDQAVVSVSDTGIGIPLEEQPHLFTRFFRSSLAQRHAIQGSGLGLSIARAVVDQHGGTMTVESCPGRGSTFRVRLPWADAPSVPVQAAGSVNSNTVP